MKELIIDALMQLKAVGHVSVTMDRALFVNGQYTVDEFAELLCKFIPQFEWPQQLPPLAGDVMEILGKPNFSVAGLAQRLFQLKLYPTHRKSEIEQATALHFMMNLYLKHGDTWRDEAEKILKGEPS